MDCNYPELSSNYSKLHSVETLVKLSNAYALKVLSNKI